MKTVCFSGYRPQKFDFLLIPGIVKYDLLLKTLDDALRELIMTGAKRFIVGGAAGFDIIAAERLILLKQEFPFIKICIYLPYPDFFKSFSIDWQQRYRAILKEASVTFINSSYFRGCYYLRNRRMVDESDFLVCFYDGKSGGTKYTKAYAEKQGKEVINVYKEAQISLFE